MQPKGSYFPKTHRISVTLIFDTEIFYFLVCHKQAVSTPTLPMTHSVSIATDDRRTQMPAPPHSLQLAVATLLPMFADTRAAALLTVGTLPPVLADACAAVLLTSAALPPMLADAPLSISSHNRGRAIPLRTLLHSRVCRRVRAVDVVIIGRRANQKF